MSAQYPLAQFADPSTWGQIVLLIVMLLYVALFVWLVFVTWRLTRNFYRRRAQRRCVPPLLPAPDAKGNYPAIEYGRMLLARRIIEARNSAGWTQAELARRAGVRKETIHRIEAGKNNPDESTFAKIEKAFTQEDLAV